MANTHFAEIGDVWKHLPLAEVLAIERPGRYWETHAGSALYPLTPSPQRDFGAYQLLADANQAAALQRSTYVRLLHQLGSADPGGSYPGSAYIAMAVLGTTVGDYRLGDADPASAADLRATAAQLVEGDRVTVVDGDGVTAILTALSTLAPAAAWTTFALLDPTSRWSQLWPASAQPSYGPGSPTKGYRPCCGTSSRRSPTTPRSRLRFTATAWTWAPSRCGRERSLWPGSAPVRWPGTPGWPGAGSSAPT
jgi:hypothetical protein